jgi:hypothetical protein
VQHPRLAGDDLDDVVAVSLLRGVEDVEDAARARAASHVHRDRGVTEGARESDTRLLLGGVRG